MNIASHFILIQELGEAEEGHPVENKQVQVSWSDCLPVEEAIALLEQAKTILDEKLHELAKNGKQEPG